MKGWSSTGNVCLYLVCIETDNAVKIVEGRLCLFYIELDKAGKIVEDQ